MTTMGNVGGHDGHEMCIACKKHWGRCETLRKMLSTSCAATMTMEVERGIKNEDIRKRGRSDLCRCTHGALFVLRHRAAVTTSISGNSVTFF
jgi:hypothetical protein